MLKNFTRFLDRSPTVFHACREVENTLAEADFTPLSEKEKWRLEPGKGYFVTRGHAAVAAFKLPENSPSGAVILSSHLDSPALKLKPNPEITNHNIGQLITEPYGAPLLYTWLDRDLVIAGKIAVADANGKLDNLLVTLDDYQVIIPSLSLHLNRQVTEKGLQIQKQDHLKPIFSLNGKERHLEDWLKKHHSFKKLISSDLFLAPSQSASYLGFESELIASYRLDNLTSAYASLQALIDAKEVKDHLQMACFWDHEEIGSTSLTGADSFFAEQVLERISLSYKMQREDFYRLKSRSINLSCDVTHGFHPNFTEKYDLQNSPFLGNGVVIKFNANQKNATSSDSAAPLINLAEAKKIPIQKYACRSDIPSGGTVGSIMAANLGIPTIDLGIACWAMHSSRETISMKDEEMLCKLLKSSLEHIAL